MFFLYTVKTITCVICSIIVKPTKSAKLTIVVVYFVTCNMFNTCNLHSYASQKHLSVTNMTLFTCEIFFRMSRGVYTEVLISFYSFAVYEVRAEYVSLLLIVRSV